MLLGQVVDGTDQQGLQMALIGFVHVSVLSQVV